MITSYFTGLNVFILGRLGTIRRLLISCSFGVCLSMQGCGAGSTVNVESTSINPVGTALTTKDIFAGGIAFNPRGRKDGEFLPGILNGGSVIRTQASLDLFWSHPVFAQTAKPDIDFTTQTVVAHTETRNAGARVLISRVSSSQVIVTICGSTTPTPGILLEYVSLKLIDVVLVGTPKFEIQNEQAALC
jgi:hypothetical protein